MSITMKRLALRTMVPVLCLAALCCTVPFAGCGLRADAGSTARLSGACTTPQQLMERALTALAERDTAGLRALLVTHEEFETYMYPELGMHYPAAMDTSAAAREFIWENQWMASEKGLKRLLRDFGGSRMKLVDVSFASEEMPYRTYAVHEGTTVKVRSESGIEADLYAFGSVVTMDGRCKLMAYRENQP